VQRYDTECYGEVPAAEYTSGRIFVKGAAIGAGAQASASLSSSAGRGSIGSFGGGAASMIRGVTSTGASGRSSVGGGVGSARQVGRGPRLPRVPSPRHSPFAPGALPLYLPHGVSPEARPAASDGSLPAIPAGSALSVTGGTKPGAAIRFGAPEVSVVLDPVLSSRLRPHQREGVKFLFECVAGMREFDGKGCILADAMGLGKTLQTICLVWTCLKQGPRGIPLCSKAVIVTPSTLVANWGREVKKWLGNERLRPVAVTAGGKAAAAAVEQFLTAPVSPVLIISYEQYRRFSKQINGMGSARRGGASSSTGASSHPVGLLICDEGHRLKQAGGNQTIRALAGCPTMRRVLLTGTPVQNDLGEFYAMASFVNPAVLGPLTTFRRVFDQPIARGRDRGASPGEQAMGEERSQELARLTSAFVLRRTQAILDKYLPPKTELTVFCKLSLLQHRVYDHLVKHVSTKCVQGMSSSSGEPAQALTLINTLTALCNHPDLIAHRLWADLAAKLDTEGDGSVQSVRASAQAAEKA